MLLACYNNRLTTECISEEKKAKVYEAESVGSMQQTIFFFRLRTGDIQVGTGNLFKIWKLTKGRCISQTKPSCDMSQLGSKSLKFPIIRKVVSVLTETTPETYEFPMVLKNVLLHIFHWQCQFSFHSSNMPKDENLVCIKFLPLGLMFRHSDPEGNTNDMDDCPEQLATPIFTEA